MKEYNQYISSNENKYDSKFSKFRLKHPGDIIIMFLHYFYIIL